MQLKQKIPTAIDRYLWDGAIAALLIILYAPLLIHWYNGWLNKSISIEHEYFSHGLIGLPFAAYIVWTNRQSWQAIPDQSNYVGLGLLAVGGVFYLSGQSELVNISFPTILAGLCLWFKGVPGLRLHSFPLLLVILATPTAFPYLIEPYALPLQRFIAGVAGFILIQFGIDVNVVGINLFVGGRIVEVAPHCAGLKMLFTSLYVSLMLLYWSGAWISRQKTTLLLIGAVLVSVMGNIIRNTLLTFFHGTGMSGAFHWLHESWGGDLYSAGMLGLLVVLLKVIERSVDSHKPIPESVSDQD